MSFATLYLLKDNNNGQYCHKSKSLATIASGHWQCNWSTEHAASLAKNTVYINWSIFPINWLITWWMVMATKRVAWDHKVWHLQIKLSKKDAKSSPHKSHTLKHFSSGTSISCSGSAPLWPWITDGTYSNTCPLHRLDRSGGEAMLECEDFNLIKFTWPPLRCGSYCGAYIWFIWKNTHSI